MMDEIAVALDVSPGWLAHWVTKAIERFSLDLQLEFPGMKGFSGRNLKYMRSFAEACGWSRRRVVCAAGCCTTALVVCRQKGLPFGRHPFLHHDLQVRVVPHPRAAS